MWKYFIKGTTVKSNSGYEFQMMYPYDRRKKESAKLRELYPDKIPTIVEKAERTKLQKMDKNKLLLPNDLKVGQLIYEIRSKIGITSKQSIYLFINNSVIPRTDDIIQNLYDKYADRDGFLYVTYCTEDTFGSSNVFSLIKLSYKLQI